MKTTVTGTIKQEIEIPYTLDVAAQVRAERVKTPGSPVGKMALGCATGLAALGMLCYTFRPLPPPSSPVPSERVVVPSAPAPVSQTVTVQVPAARVIVKRESKAARARYNAHVTRQILALLDRR